VIDKVKTYFEKYFGISGAASFLESKGETLKYLDPQNNRFVVAEKSTEYGSDN
jgi:type I restriction enzyme, R subunit